MTRALVIGGTGPTGPHVLQGLLDRGYDVTMFHRGTHEPADLPEVAHIHGDPHFRENIEEALGVQEYDLVLAAYGRARLLAEHFVGRTGRFMSISGAPRYAGYNRTGLRLEGLPTPVPESAPLVTGLGETVSAAVRFGQKMVATEEAVFGLHPEASVFVYPLVYGPRNVVPWEWSVIKRVRDGRERIVLPDGGTAIHSRGFGRNVAQFVLDAVDHPREAAGQVFNCADDVQYSLRQWVELILEALGSDAEITGVPTAFAPDLARAYLSDPQSLCDNCLFDTTKAQERLGHSDVVSTRDALVESVAWYEQNPVQQPESIAGFHDRLDYAAEDELLEACASMSRGFEEDFVHPMPHPKKAGLTIDEMSR